MSALYRAGERSSRARTLIPDTGRVMHGTASSLARILTLALPAAAGDDLVGVDPALLAAAAAAADPANEMVHPDPAIAAAAARAATPGNLRDSRDAIERERAAFEAEVAAGRAAVEAEAVVRYERARDEGRAAGEAELAPLRESLAAAAAALAAAAPASGAMAAAVAELALAVARKIVGAAVSADPSLLAGRIGQAVASVGLDGEVTVRVAPSAREAVAAALADRPGVRVEAVEGWEPGRAEVESPATRIDASLPAALEAVAAALREEAEAC